MVEYKDVWKKFVIGDEIDHDNYIDAWDKCAEEATTEEKAASAQWIFGYLEQMDESDLRHRRAIVTAWLSAIVYGKYLEEKVKELEKKNA